MRSAAIDLGKVRVGLAISDELGLMAHARPFLDGSNPGQVVDALTTFASKENVDVFVVGLPRTLDGREGAPARRARMFARKLQICTGRRVILMDERLTTKQASQQLSAIGRSAREQRTIIDSVAAALLLQAYLDASQRKPRP
jgi:putative Holliday junction resolvase